MAARLSQATIEAIATSLQRARLSQAALEAIGGTVASVRVSQAAIEAIQQANAQARLTHLVLEAVYQYQLLYLSQVVLEAVSVPGAHLADLSQLVLETAGAGPATARLTQIVADVLGSNPALAARVTQAVIEVLTVQNQSYLSTALAEVLGGVPARARLGQAAGEAVVTGTATARLGHLLLEVLIPRVGVLLSQGLIEALVSGARAWLSQVVVEVIGGAAPPVNHMRMRVSSVGI